MSMLKSTLMVGGEEKTVVCVNHTEELNEATTTSLVVNRLHHIHVIDRSGSMYSSIDQLIDTVKQTFAVISDSDLITLIWFSGAGQHRTVIKGATKFDKLDNILDTLRSTVGCTCFSDPMKEINLILDEIGDIAPSCVTFFTDGNPVVSWSQEKEEQMCFEELGKMKSRIIAFNVVAFGNYVNQDLLRSFSATSEYGIMCHASKIDDYLSIFSHNFETISDVVCESITIDAPTVIYLNRKFSKMENGNLHLSRINPRKNQFFLIGDGEFFFSYQGKEYHTADIKINLQPGSKTNFFYAYAYNMYYAGDRKESLGVVNQLRDKALIDSHMNAFTFDESGRHLERLSKALFTPASGRMVEGIAPENYVPADDAHCVMDVLNALQLGNSFFVPFGKNAQGYSRIGKKATDEFNLFTKTTDEVRAPFSSFVDNKKKMNLSVLVKIPGTVKIPPKTAQRVNLESTFPSFIWRNYTVIKDGNINIPRMEVLLSAEDFLNPMILPAIEEGSVSEHVDIMIDGELKTFTRVVLDLASLPIINRKYISEVTTIRDIFTSTAQINRLEAFQKCIGYQLEKFPVTQRKGTGEFAVLTEEQIAVLLEMGVAKDGSYSGTEISKKKAEDCDSYEARTMEFYLAGFTSWPKFTDLFERKEKIAAEAATGKGKAKLTPAMAKLDEEMTVLESIIAGKGLLLESTDLNVMVVLLDLQKETKKDLQRLRGELNALKIAKLLSGDWFSDLMTDEKGEYYFEQAGVKMVARVARTTEYY